MNSIHMRTGLFFVSLLVGFTQPVLSAALVFEDSQRKVPCGQVENLTVTSALVTAKGNISCLNVSSADTPTAAPQNLGSVDINSHVSKDLTVNAVVKLPLPATHLKLVDSPKLPGSSVSMSGSTATYYAPSSDDITASANDSFTYTITDATGKTSPSARVDVSVKWVDVPSDGCKSGNGIVCMGPVPDWPETHDTTTYALNGGATHVWSFVYSTAFAGQIGATLSTGKKALKISKGSGDTVESTDGCWVSGNEYVYYEPTLGYDCRLELGQKYYFNIRNLDGISSKYHLTAF